MPDLGHTMETGRVVEWLKVVGDPVNKGETLAIIESDKVSVEIESPGAGVLLKVVAEAGAEVPVGATLGLVGAPGEADASEKMAVEILARQANSAAADAAREGAPEGGAVAARSALAARKSERRKERSRASPVARKTAEELGVDLATVAGTGPRGLISKDDVMRAAAESNASEAAAVARDVGDIVRIPLTGTRGAIAERMQRSWRLAPMVTLVSYADVGALLRRREEDGDRVSINDLIARALAIALTGHPALNAWLIGDAIEQVGEVNLSVAVAHDEGLAVPVVRSAQRKTVYEISHDIKRLSEAAKADRLEPADVADGTFTITNLGAWGIDLFTPILNPPQVGILGVGRVNQHPVPSADSVAFVDRLGLCLVFDHRATDGAHAAAMLQSLVAVLGEPDHLYAAAE